VDIIDSSPSDNGRGTDAWLRSWIHLRIDRRSAGYCRVTFDHPPVNAVTAETVAELAELVELIQEDADLNVVVFDSADARFYLTHDDTGTAPSAMRAWQGLLVRLSRAAVVSIAAIRGRVRGAGAEFVLACDLRFASLENTRLGQFDVGAGPVPGAVSITRLSRLAGRGRALEILLAAGDLDGRRAEQYWYVNRLITDDQLDDEVDRIASRLAHADRHAITRTKSSVG
jgi:enoyl-CoA hydratase/carnithine racemase